MIAPDWGPARGPVPGLFGSTEQTRAGRYITDPSPNSYPRLPVREGEQVFVWLASFARSTATPAADSDCAAWAHGATCSIRLGPAG